MKKIAYLLILCAASALAQNPTTTFLGIQFGQPLPTSQECPKKQVSEGLSVYDHAAYKDLCWQGGSKDGGISDGYFTYHNVIKGKGDLHDAEGMSLIGGVAEVKLWLFAAEGPTFLKALIEKYGQPTITSDEPMVSVANVHVTCHTAVWTLKNIEVRYSSVDRDVTKASIEAYSFEYKEMMLASLKDTSKSIKDSF